MKYIFCLYKFFWRVCYINIGLQYCCSPLSCNSILTRCLALDEADWIRDQKERRKENPKRTRHFIVSVWAHCKWLTITVILLCSHALDAAHPHDRETFTTTGDCCQISQWSSEYTPLLFYKRHGLNQPPTIIILPRHTRKVSYLLVSQCIRLPINDQNRHHEDIILCV